MSSIAWRGSAKDTLAIEEQWKDIKVQGGLFLELHEAVLPGAEELSVPARTEHTCLQPRVLVSDVWLRCLPRHQGQYAPLDLPSEGI